MARKWPETGKETVGFTLWRQVGGVGPNLEDS